MIPPVRIGNCSGFFGDRLSAAREIVEAGDVDVLTGDWLAELTMLILARQRMKFGPGSGYARTFLAQMEQVLGTCLDRGTKVVTNAGGLDPEGLAKALREKADELGLSRVRIAWVTGDDLTLRFADLQAGGEQFINLDTGEPFSSVGMPALTANAYLGAEPVAAALAAGADVVITGRITDAALVVGPAAWWHRWDFDAARAGDQATLDALAGAVVAGHVVECGAQATGGNYPFFQDVPGLEHPGFPIAVITPTGSSMITKAEGTGGQVSVGTVTAQLLYEIGSPHYANPDVTADFGTISLRQNGADNVVIEGVKGLPAPERLKVALNYLGGFRNTMSLVLTGLDAREKASLALRTVTGVSLDDALASRDPRALAAASTLPVSELSVAFDDTSKEDPRTIAEAQSHLRLTVKDLDPKKVGKPFTTSIIEAALSSYPGMFPTAPPGEGTPFGVYWPTTVDRSGVTIAVLLDGEPVETAETLKRHVADWPWSPSGGLGAGSGGRGVGGPSLTASLEVPLRVTDPPPDGAPVEGSAGSGSGGLGAGAPSLTASLEVPLRGSGPQPGVASAAVRAPLGSIAGARSGDKGGNANIGVWARDLTGPLAEAQYEFLRDLLVAEAIPQLIPEAEGFEVEVHQLPNLSAVNIVIKGFLGRGVADSTSLDPQAKGLGEFLRARHVEIPEWLMGGAS